MIDQIKKQLSDLTKKEWMENFTDKSYVKGYIKGLKTSITISNAMTIITMVCVISYLISTYIQTKAIKDQNKILSEYNSNLKETLHILLTADTTPCE